LFSLTIGSFSEKRKYWQDPLVVAVRDELSLAEFISHGNH